MLRIVILTLLALAVAALVTRLLMRRAPRLRARAAGIMRSPSSMPAQDCKLLL